MIDHDDHGDHDDIGEKRAPGDNHESSFTDNSLQIATNGLRPY